MTPKKTKRALAHPMEKLLQKKSLPKIVKRQEIEGKIVSLSQKKILFDIGAKTYALLGNREIKEISPYLPYLKEGSKVKVRVVSEEARDGFPIVSMRNFFNKGKWDILKEKKENEEKIEVFCGDYGKGGVFIDFMGIRGVIPKIQLLEEFINHPERIRRKKIKVKILEVDRKKNRLVVSHKAAVFNISQKELTKKFNKIKEGKTYKAKILGTSNFGIFCDVQGVEGLIHISEISWEKVSDPLKYIKVGEERDVLVVEKNKKDFKLNLSLKRLSNDPWKDIEKKYLKDKEVEGEIVRKERYGLFVRLERGVEGLIHTSKLTGKENFKKGQKIKVYVERANKRERRMSLILPQKEKPVTYR